MSRSSSYGCVYHVRNLRTGKGYVGQHNNAATVERRWNAHLIEARAGSPYPFHRALRKYGVAGFSWEVIWRGSVLNLNKMETQFIKDLSTLVATGAGYNLTTGGRTRWKFSKQTRLRIAASTKIRFTDEDERRKLSVASSSRYCNVQEREKTSQAVSNYFSSNPKAAELSSVTAKKTWARYRSAGLHTRAKGVPKPTEQTEKAKATRAERYEDPATRENLRLAQRARFADTEKAARHKAVFQDPSVRRAMSEAAKAAWARRKAA